MTGHLVRQTRNGQTQYLLDPWAECPARTTMQISNFYVQRT